MESITVERDMAHEKMRLEHRYAELIYDGLWLSPLRQALDAFFAESQRHVTGEVKLKLEPRVCRPIGRRSPKSLDDYGLATYDAADSFHRGRRGLRPALGLGVQTWTARQG